MRKQAYQIETGTEAAKDLFYSGSEREKRCIGHLRGDFGGDGDEFWTNFWPHDGVRLSGDDFNNDLNILVRTLREGLLRSRRHMRRFIQQHPLLTLESGAVMAYGYQVIADRYEYYVRCTPQPGCYDFYIYAYLGGELNMSNTWKFNGRDLDPSNLPTKEEIISGILVMGGQSVDREAVLGWDYGEYGNGLCYWYCSAPDEEVGGVLMPVQEGILYVPFGSYDPSDEQGIKMKYIGILSQEECWDVMDNCLMFRMRRAAYLWKEAANISGIMGNHESED